LRLEKRKPRLGERGLDEDASRAWGLL